jgi:predicted DNA-binding transcriptional regulator AlpA
MVPELSENALLRLPQVLALVPVSRSTWWAGCKSGRFPKPVKLGPRTTAWRASDIAALLERISGEKRRKSEKRFPRRTRPSRPLLCR